MSCSRVPVLLYHDMSLKPNLSSVVPLHLNQVTFFPCFEIQKLTMEADADEYEMLATGIFANCFLQSPSKSFNLLIVRLPKWGGYTCLHVAIEARDKVIIWMRLCRINWLYFLNIFQLFSQRFVSSPGVQNFFDHIWTSRLSHNHSLHLIVAGFLLFPIFTTVNFEEKEDDETDMSSNAIENGSKDAVRKYWIITWVSIRERD